MILAEALSSDSTEETGAPETQTAGDCRAAAYPWLRPPFHRFASCRANRVASAREVNVVLA